MSIGSSGTTITNESHHNNIHHHHDIHYYNIYDQTSRYLSIENNYRENHNGNIAQAQGIEKQQGRVRSSFAYSDVIVHITK